MARIHRCVRISLQRASEHGVDIPRGDDGQVLGLGAWLGVRERIDGFFSKWSTGDGDSPEEPTGERDGSPNPRAGYVYLLRLENPADPEVYKIGKTVDLERRFRPIVLQLPYPVRLMWAWKCSDIDFAETFLHRRYSEKRLNGEWFRLDMVDCMRLAALRHIEPLSEYVKNPELEHERDGGLWGPFGGAAQGHPLAEPVDTTRFAAEGSDSEWSS